MSQELQKQIDELKAVLDSKESTADEKVEAAKVVKALLDIQAAQLEIEERQYHIQDLKAKIADRDIREKQITEDRAAQGKTIAQQEATDNYRFSVCTHRKGGMASPRNLNVLYTGGNAAQYAVMKHQMINGDIWVRCLRCGKTWAPPVEANFHFDDKGRRVAAKDGLFNKARFDAAVEEYKKATMFETNNSMSTSVQCRFSRVDKDGRVVDAADVYRENIASTNLR